MAENDQSILARLDERTEAMAEDLKKLKHVILEGNGSPAMTVQVATLDARVKAIEEERKEAKIPRHVTVGLIVSVILGVAGMLVGFAQ